MKDFAMTSIAALLMAGFYALGSAHHSSKIDQLESYPAAVTDTVPERNDTLNKKMPGDTMSRKDSLHKRDSPQ